MRRDWEFDPSELPADLALPEGASWKPEVFKRKVSRRTIVPKISCYELNGVRLKDLHAFLSKLIRDNNPKADSPLFIDDVIMGHDSDYDESWLTICVDTPETDEEYLTRLRQHRKRLISSLKGRQAAAAKRAQR